MGKKNKQPNVQLSFKPRLSADEVKPYFQPLDADDKVLTTEEINKGLAGLWRGLGSKGYLTPETAMFLVKANQSNTDTKLLEMKTEYLSMKNEQLAEQLGKNKLTEPSNEYEPAKAETK